MPFALSTRPVGDGGTDRTVDDAGFALSLVAGKPLGIFSRELEVSNFLTPLPLPIPVPALLPRELLARLDSGLELPAGLISTPLPLPPLMLPTLTPMLPALFLTRSSREEAEDVRASVRPRRSFVPYTVCEVSRMGVGEEERGERGMGIGVVAPPMEASDA